MITAIDKNEKFSIALETEKDNSPFKCKVCFEEVILKKGKIKIHHFAHKSKSDCSYGGESLAHLEAKYSLYKKFKNKLNDTEIEYTKFKYFIPDVYVKSFKLSLEIQKSKLSKEVFWNRTEKYIENNIRVLWIFLNDEIKFKDGNVKMSKMMNESCRLYKNKIYVYDKSWNYIEKWDLLDVYNEYEYYDESAQLCYSSRLLKTSKKIKEVTRLYEKFLS